MRLSFALPKICTGKEVSALYCQRPGKDPLPCLAMTPCAAK